MGGELGEASLTQGGQQDDHSGDHPVLQELPHGETLHRIAQLPAGGRPVGGGGDRTAFCLLLQRAHDHLDTQRAGEAKTVGQQAEDRPAQQQTSAVYITIESTNTELSEISRQTKFIPSIKE